MQDGTKRKCMYFLLSSAFRWVVERHRHHFQAKWNDARSPKAWSLHFARSLSEKDRELFERVRCLLVEPYEKNARPRTPVFLRYRLT